eukprot:jgi/Mesen1/3518/ME000197S02535
MSVACGVGPLLHHSIDKSVFGWNNCPYTITTTSQYCPRGKLLRRPTLFQSNSLPCHLHSNSLLRRISAGPIAGEKRPTPSSSKRGNARESSGSSNNRRLASAWSDLFNRRSSSNNDTSSDVAGGRISRGGKGRTAQVQQNGEAELGEGFLAWLAQILPGGPPGWYQGFTESQVSYSAAACRALWVAFCAALALLVKVAAFNPTCVPSASMAPTLLPGDCVFVEIVSSLARVPARRGDIVVFYPPLGVPGYSSPSEMTLQRDGSGVDFGAGGAGAAGAGSRPPQEGARANGVQFVKRVVGIPGDVVQVSVNGIPRAEEARAFAGRLQVVQDGGASEPQPASDSLLLAKYEVAPVPVPPNSLFVLVSSSLSAPIVFHFPSVVPTRSDSIRQLLPLVRL